MRNPFGNLAFLIGPLVGLLCLFSAQNSQADDVDHDLFFLDPESITPNSYMSNYSLPTSIVRESSGFTIYASPTLSKRSLIAFNSISPGIRVRPFNQNLIQAAGANGSFGLLRDDLQINSPGLRTIDLDDRDSEKLLTLQSFGGLKQGNPSEGLVYPLIKLNANELSQDFVWRDGSEGRNYISGLPLGTLKRDDIIGREVGTDGGGGGVSPYLPSIPLSPASGPSWDGTTSSGTYVYQQPKKVAEAAKITAQFSTPLSSLALELLEVDPSTFYSIAWQAVAPHYESLLGATYRDLDVPKDYLPDTRVYSREDVDYLPSSISRNPLGAALARFDPQDYEQTTYVVRLYVSGRGTNKHLKAFTRITLLAQEGRVKPSEDSFRNSQLAQDMIERRRLLVADFTDNALEQAAQDVNQKALQIFASSFK